MSLVWAVVIAIILVHIVGIIVFLRYFIPNMLALEKAYLNKPLAKNAIIEIKPQIKSTPSVENFTAETGIFNHLSGKSQNQYSVWGKMDYIQSEYADAITERYG